MPAHEVDVRLQFDEFDLSGTVVDGGHLLLLNRLLELGLLVEDERQHLVDVLAGQYFGSLLAQQSHLVALQPVVYLL